jgi:hypothetical protein
MNNLGMYFALAILIMLALVILYILRGRISSNPKVELDLQFLRSRAHSFQ